MAAVGDMFDAMTSIANGAYIDIQPAASHEVVIHNIYWVTGSDVEVYRYDGANEVKMQPTNNDGLIAFYAFHCNNTRRIRVKNISGAPMYIAYDGIYTKVA